MADKGNKFVGGFIIIIIIIDTTAENRAHKDQNSREDSNRVIWNSNLRLTKYQISAEPSWPPRQFSGLTRRGSLRDKQQHFNPLSYSYSCNKE